MKPEQDNFEALQRLLKLKRHEQPPPRYFNDFSTQVIRRIQTSTPEERANFLETLYAEAPWLQRLVRAFDAKPAIAWAGGLAACALIVSGIVYSESVEGTSPSALNVPDRAVASEETSTPLMALGQTPGDSVANFGTSTAPITQPAGTTLFDLIPAPSAQPSSLGLSQPANVNR